MWLQPESICVHCTMYIHAACRIKIKFSHRGKQGRCKEELQQVRVEVVEFWKADLAELVEQKTAFRKPCPRICSANMLILPSFPAASSSFSCLAKHLKSDGERSRELSWKPVSLPWLVWPEPASPISQWTPSQVFGSRASPWPTQREAPRCKGLPLQTGCWEGGCGTRRLRGKTRGGAFISLHKRHHICAIAIAIVTESDTAHEGSVKFTLRSWD